MNVFKKNPDWKYLSIIYNNKFINLKVNTLKLYLNFKIKLVIKIYSFKIKSRIF